MANALAARGVSDPFMDALRVKVRDGGHFLNEAIYIALGVNMNGR